MKHWATYLPESVILSFGIAGSLIAGMVVAGTSTVGWTRESFEFVVLGTAVSAIFIGWKRKGFLESTTHALSYALFCAIPAREDMVGVFVFCSMFFLFACAAIHLIWNRRWSIGRFVLLGLSFGLFETARILLFRFILPDDFPGGMYFDLRARVVLGLSVGFAIESAEWLVHSIEARGQTPKRVRK